MLRQATTVNQPVIAPSLVWVVAQARPPIDKLRKYGATEFKGKIEDDPSTAEY